MLKILWSLLRFGEEDIDGVMDMFADSALWSPPV